MERAKTLLVTITPEDPLATFRHKPVSYSDLTPQFLPDRSLIMLPYSLFDVDDLLRSNISLQRINLFGVIPTQRWGTEGFWAGVFDSSCGEVPGREVPGRDSGRDPAAGGL